MIRYIDTHTHLYDEAFDSDRDEVIEAVKKSGVVKCVLPGIDVSTFERQQNFVNANKGFAFQAIGLHPTSVNGGWEKEYDFVRNELLLNGNNYVAVGEIGLDGYWSKDFMKEQMTVLKKQILWAYKLDLPVILHVREATDEIFQVLDEVLAELSIKKMSGHILEGAINQQYNGSVKQLKGVFHAFTGSFEMFERINSYGNFRVGIGGVVTYKNCGLSESLKKIPLSYVLLETDSPWLAPIPKRGTRNDSSNIRYVAQRVAEIKNVPLEEVAETATKNAEDLFRI